MARIPYFDPARAEGRAKAQYAKLPALNVFRMMGHAGEMLDGVVRLGSQITTFSELDPVLREIAIIRVGVLSAAAYEVHQHRRIGRAIGMSQALLDGIAEGPDAAVFDEAQRQVMLFTDEAVIQVRPSDAVFNPLLDRLGPKRLQELVIAIGYYMLLCRFLETFDVDIEPAETAPPDDQLPGVRRP
jgi:4-carboxymuconolactone decarboxylase